MGAGKTAVGKLLAAELKRKFVDTDQLVEEKVQLSIPQIFKVHGEDFFRDRESEAVASLKQYPPGSLVVATGGGVILREANRLLLKKNSLVVYLKATPEELFRRTQTGNLRPLLTGMNPAQKIITMLSQREDLYRDCHLEIDTTTKLPEQVVSEIISHFKACEA